jgi:molybdate transport system ATP-binding protein
LKENFIPSYQHQTFFSKKISLTRTSFSFNTIIEMKNVHVQYGEKIILQNINWKVKCGEHWLVKGHNGAGKSTLLSLITADNPQAYSNEIYLLNKRRGKGESIWDIKQKIGFVSPELHKYFDTGITAEQTIASGFFDTMGLYKKLNTQQQKAVNDWINYFELTALKNTLLSLLSAGQQRWVLLARALVKQPPLLVLDEPCQGLDEPHTASFIQLIDTIADQTNTTIIYVSHYANEIPTCIDKILALENGIQTIHQNLKTKAA